VLGVLLFAIMAAGLVARGQRRYARYMKDEAAQAQVQAQAAMAETDAVKTRAERARAQARQAMVRGEPARAQAMTSWAPEWLAKALAQPAGIQPEPDTTQTQPLRALPQETEDDTVILKAVRAAGTRRATGD
jgi:hypothetical protein